MANIDQIKGIVDTFYKIKKGIQLPELYILCNASTNEEVNDRIQELIEAKQIKFSENKLVPFETN